MLAAVDQGSFTAAADFLGLTHGSVSRRIAQLEHWLGTAVFERRARGVVLTPAGQRFASVARQAVDLLGEQVDQWRPRAGRRVVKLTVVPSFARLWLLPRLKQIQGDDLTVELMTEHRPSDLDAREADIAIRYGSGAFNDVDARLLFAETLIPCASRKLAQELPHSPSGELLHKHALIHDSNYAQWQNWLRTENISYRPRMTDRRFEDYDLVLEAAAAGLGIALLRLPLAQGWVDRGLLVKVSNRTISNPLGHFVVTRKHEQREEVMRLSDRILRAVAEPLLPEATKVQSPLQGARSTI
ncbi:MAG: LysR substrate-binding domain-containing protein [Usitatibacteraceae bacterium]